MASKAARIEALRQLQEQGDLPAWGYKEFKRLSGDKFARMDAAKQMDPIAILEDIAPEGQRAKVMAAALSDLLMTQTRTPQSAESIAGSKTLLSQADMAPRYSDNPELNAWINNGPMRFSDHDTRSFSVPDRYYNRSGRDGRLDYLMSGSTEDKEEHERLLDFLGATPEDVKAIRIDPEPGFTGAIAEPQFTPTMFNYSHAYANEPDVSPHLNDADRNDAYAFAFRAKGVPIEHRPGEYSAGNVPIKTPFDFSAQRPVMLTPDEPKSSGEQIEAIDQTNYPFDPYSEATIEDSRPTLFNRITYPEEAAIASKLPVVKRSDFRRLLDANEESDFAQAVRTAMGNKGLLALGGVALAGALGSATADAMETSPGHEAATGLEAHPWLGDLAGAVDTVALDKGDVSYHEPSGGTVGAAATFLPIPLSATAAVMGAAAAGQELGNTWPQAEPAMLGEKAQQLLDLAGRSPRAVALKQLGTPGDEAR